VKLPPLEMGAFHLVFHCDFLALLQGFVCQSFCSRIRNIWNRAAGRVEERQSRGSGGGDVCQTQTSQTWQLLLPLLG